MALKSKKQQTTEKIYGTVIPVVSCSDFAQVIELMRLCGIARSLTYNKLGSLKGWTVNWMFAAPIIREICSPQSIGMDKCRKIWEWAVSDTMKAINAQTEAAKTKLKTEIWRKYPMQHQQKERIQWIKLNQHYVTEAIKSLNLPSGKDNQKLRDDAKYSFQRVLNDVAVDKFPKCEIEKSRDWLLHLLEKNPTGHSWLHRRFRDVYQRGHTYKRNQIVYQGEGYRCTRVNRHSVELSLMGINARQKITLRLRCRHIISGQIRLILNDNSQLELHTIRKRTLVLPSVQLTEKIGIDKGYTEAFYTSDGVSIASGLGVLMSRKTARITSQNRNRYRLRCYAQNNPKTHSNIFQYNLGYKVKSRRLKREKSTIQNFIRRDLRLVITKPVEIICEDLSQPIKGKKFGKKTNRNLNQWMKGELQASIDKIALEKGAKVSLVNCAFTSQVDCQTGTLLGFRNGDCFTTYSGVVMQADKNAAINIRNRSTDGDINRYMKSDEVKVVLLNRTIRYLHSIGKTVTESLNLGWLNPKFEKLALQLESKYLLQG